MKPLEGKPELEGRLNVLKFRISDLQKRKETVLADIETEGNQIFTENSIDELYKCKEQLVQQYKRKDEVLGAIDEKLDNFRKSKDEKQRQLDQLQFSDRDQSETSIKIKDYRERILQLINVDLSGNETDAKLNEKVLKTAQSQVDSLTKEVNTESQKLEDQEQNMENELNNYRSSLSSKEGLNDNNEHELVTTTQKIQLLADEIAKFNKNPKGNKKTVDDEIAKVNDSIDDCKENLAIDNDKLNKLTKELVETTEKIRNSAKNKV